MNQPAQLFRPWVSPWAIRICILLLLVPNLLLFTISTASIPAACGFYGIDPNDANYTLVVLYGALVGFFPLERRLSAYLVTRDYLLLSLVMEILTALGAYFARDLAVLLVFRFLQGIANICLVAICISLIFNHLQTERSREIGYSVVYCLLLCIAPITVILTAPLLDQVDYNILYLGIAYAFLPGGIFAMVIMRRRQLAKKIPVYQLDWQSFVIYTAMIISLTYALVYGQQLNWFTDPRITFAAILFLGCLLLYVLRQLHLKRPLLDVRIFRHASYRMGACLILVLYLARGSFNYTTQYFTQVLGMDPDALGRILVFNIAGAIAGTLVSSRMMIFQRPFKLIWITGFTFLLAYAVWMLLLFSPQANFSAFYLPLLVQGIGTGMLLTPIIVYMVRSVPAEFGPTAGATAVSMRLLGTTLSIAAINYFQLVGSRTHTDRFQERLTAADPDAVKRLGGFTTLFRAHGQDLSASAAGGSALWKNWLEQQAFLRTSIDYYTLISAILLLTILILAIRPKLAIKKVRIDPIRDIPV